MVLFLIITLVLNFLCGFVCLILNFNFIYVVFMCLDAGVLSFLIPAYVTGKKEEKILEFWNMVGNMPPKLQKAILDADDICECSKCGCHKSKYEMGSFCLDDWSVEGGILYCRCKKCNKKRMRH